VGLKDRLVRALTGDIEKAPNLPAGAVTLTEQQITAGSIGQSYGNNVPLPRNPYMAMVPFGPGLPITPGAINPLDPNTGRPEPRRYEYQVAQNINITETRVVPFSVLRATSDQVDIIRRCIEVIKGKIVSLDWDIVLGQDAAEKIGSDSGKDRVRALASAREGLDDEINRIRTFWENPDKSNGYTFADWINISLEEILVLDAWAVWPQPSVGGDLYGLQVLDGSTIKPMLDDRGMRPMPPVAAYQQILYGFPRSEFAANNDDPKADGEFTADDLAYMVRNRRAMSVYGFSPVERALPLADIYLRRQQWIRSEYTDGVLPQMMFKTDATWGTNPDLIRAYENIFNDDLSGQTAQRQRARLLPAGIEPIMPEGYGERFKDTLDDFLIASICGHFGVQPTEIGFSPKNGLGGAGFEKGKADNAELIGIEPLVNWINKMITNLSYTYLGMPRELEFKLMPSRKNDTIESAQKTDLEIKGFRKSVNEVRSEDGLPLIDSPEADMPMLVNGTGIFLFSPEGIISAAKTPDATAPEVTYDQSGNSTENETPVEEPKPETGNTVKSEVRRFLKWANKGAATRQFEFEYIDPIVAEALNRCAFEGDLDTARSLTKAYLA
jgi:hypothetical protein